MRRPPDGTRPRDQYGALLVRLREVGHVLEEELGVEAVRAAGHRVGDRAGGEPPARRWAGRCGGDNPAAAQALELNARIFAALAALD
ncbi:MAG: hypothetical protein KA180_15120 [Gemmatimonadales bacterium]|nr:hypothetical protein [Gemmatimonadales bacterium]